MLVAAEAEHRQLLAFLHQFFLGILLVLGSGDTYTSEREQGRQGCVGGTQSHLTGVRAAGPLGRLAYLAVATVEVGVALRNEIGANRVHLVL